MQTKFTLVLITYGASDWWGMVDTQILDTNKAEETYDTRLHLSHWYNHSYVSGSINL